MPDKDSQHGRTVDRWMIQAAQDLSVEQLMCLFQEALHVLCRRADLMLGDVTITAIMNRVLHYTAEKFPLFEAVQIEACGINRRQLRHKIDMMTGDRESELRAAIRFMLTEFLAVVGRLTAEVLSSTLHSELLNVSLADPTSGEKEPERKIIE